VAAPFFKKESMMPLYRIKGMISHDVEAYIEASTEAVAREKFERRDCDMIIGDVADVQIDRVEVKS